MSNLLSRSLAACVAAAALTLLSPMCAQAQTYNQIVVETRGQTVTANLDYDPYQKKYYYYYYDPVTGKRTRVSAQYFEEHSVRSVYEAEEAKRLGEQSRRLLDAVARQRSQELSREIEESQRRAFAGAMPGGVCPGSVAGQQLKDLTKDIHIMFAKIRECLGGNGFGSRQ